MLSHRLVVAQADVCRDRLVQVLLERVLVFPALQTYTGGEVVRWIGSPDADEPAPRIQLTAAAGESNTSPTTTTAAAQDEGDDDSDRSNLALGIAIAVLAAALVALGVAIFRRPGRA